MICEGTCRYLAENLEGNAEGRGEICEECRMCEVKCTCCCTRRLASDAGNGSVFLPHLMAEAWSA